VEPFIFGQRAQKPGNRIQPTMFGRPLDVFGQAKQL